MAELGTPERRSGAATRRRTPPASRSARTRAARAGQETASTAVDQGQRVASRAVDHGQQVATTAGRQVRDVAGTAREQAAAVTEDMVDQARGLVDQSRRQVQEQAETQFERVAAGLRRLGGEVQALAEGRPDQAGAMRDYAEQAAERLADVAEAIESKGPTGLLDDLKALARERPGAFVLGAAVAGLAVGRGDPERGGRRPGGGGGQRSGPAGAALVDERARELTREIERARADLRSTLEVGGPRGPLERWWPGPRPRSRPRPPTKWTRCGTGSAPGASSNDGHRRAVAR